MRRRLVAEEFKKNLRNIHGIGYFKRTLKNFCDARDTSGDDNVIFSIRFLFKYDSCNYNINDYIFTDEKRARNYFCKIITAHFERRSVFGTHYYCDSCDYENEECGAYYFLSVEKCDGGYSFASTHYFSGTCFTVTLKFNYIDNNSEEPVLSLFVDDDTI